jgi:hypothetical protein
MLHVICFSKDRGARRSRDAVLPRDEAGIAHVSSGTPPPQIVSAVQGFSGEDAEKSSTDANQRVDHDARKSEWFRTCRTHCRLSHLDVLQHRTQRAIAYGRIGYHPSWSLSSPLSA